MRTFECECGARLFFENTQCVACERELGFLPKPGQLSALDPADDGKYLALADGTPQRKCANYVDHGVCNWMVPASEADQTLCQACRLNHVVPDLSDPTNRELWATMEAAKRRLLYSLNGLGLPVEPSEADGPSLSFDIKADTPDEHVTTGHSDGLITLNVAEADPVAREKMRVDMHEEYRTPLGHFRHESGHYYWTLLVDGTPVLEDFRALFGDEQQDYGEALKAHYESPRSDWQQSFISSYASSHPWEDWAETWAHYLLITDAMETAHQMGLLANHAPPDTLSFEQLLRRWYDLSVATTAMNRSMGLPDPYPFQPTSDVEHKLSFVHTLLRSSSPDRDAPS